MSSRNKNTIVSCSSSLTPFTNTITTSNSISTPCLYTNPHLLNQSSIFNSSDSVFTQDNNVSQINNTPLPNEGPGHASQVQYVDQIFHSSWQVVKPTNKKRKSQSDENSLKLKIVKTAEPSITSPNYYAPIDMEDTEDIQINENKRKEYIKVPPVYIHGVINYQEMMSNILTVLTEGEYYCKSLANNLIKINPKSIEAYRSLVKHCCSQGIVFHTYQAKEDKPYRVVIRNIHHSVQTNEIKAELETLGFKVRNVTNILRRVTKDPLNLFFVDLEPDVNNKKVYDVQYLLHMKIAVEPPRKSSHIAQCTRCQSYGHTKTYCTRPFSCVRCGSNHSSASCKKGRDTPATCALCEGAHPANYKGCSVYQDLQKQKKKASNKHFSNNFQPPTISPNANQDTSTKRNTSYAQVLRNNHYHEKQSENIEENTERKTDITLTSFLHEFKTMFNQLLAQNSMIINMLNTVISKVISK